ncbi:PAS domain-containing sensor histidine kinase [Spirosoma pulveris]
MTDSLSRAPWLFFSFDDQGVILAGNPAVAQVAGLPVAQLVGSPVSRLLTKSGQFFYETHFFPTLQLALRADEVFMLFRQSTGEPLPVLVYGVRWQQDGQWINECHGAPIPQRRLLEQALIQARQEAQDALRQNKALTQAKQALEEQQLLLDKRIRQVERANDELRQITHIASHDLLEPIRKIALLSDLLQHPPPQQPINRLALPEQISAICQSASRLITGLRDYMALDHQEPPISWVDLTPVVWQAAEKAVQSHPVAAGWLVVDPLPAIVGDALQLEHLFVHLLTNALTYRKADEPLRVEVRAQIIQENKFTALPEKYQYTDHLQLRIRDNGIGFSPHYQQAVFLLLKRLGSASQSLGLGLAICKKIVTNHYGTISAESLPGQGTTITVVLPLQPN